MIPSIGDLRLMKRRPRPAKVKPEADTRGFPMTVTMGRELWCRPLAESNVGSGAPGSLVGKGLM
ncbi:hypothetical protein Aph01nite_18820 [Acrocarpospora phusangensis]|uniref:Uncharacterized protein n=1 Tax=Acrocarpospora phusangensis TaxID=1070424 RepID=A0A919Q764_9ACTN|nr:hypothetical protein Aph01nite_18820 [Acrocarpospora phusangensis]